MTMVRIRKGDTVAVLSGKDRGKRGKIIEVLPGRGMARVERLNLLKHFERRTAQDKPGGIIEREAPIALGKLAPVCPRCDRPSKVGFRAAEGQAKQRVCRRCGEVLGG